MNSAKNHDPGRKYNRIYTWPVDKNWPFVLENSGQVGKRIKSAS
jgi:hypothetical protein